MKDSTWQIINEIKQLIPSNKIVDFNKLIEKVKEIESDVYLCECLGCPNEATYEGWWAVVDFTGAALTGLMQKRRVCEEHKYLLNNK
jgi:hypothetical protein